MLLTLIKWYLHNISHGIMRTLIRIMLPILKLLLYITVLYMVLTWSATQYHINIVSILGIWTKNCLIPPSEEELMGRHRCTREIDYPYPA